MSTVINLADARARGIDLPADDAVAQDILDEQEAWLAQRIGALTGSRTEKFFVGNFRYGKLGLARYTDSVTIEDNGSAVDADAFRLVDSGSAVVKLYTTVSHYWNGPYVEVTYEPNDETVVRSVLYDLVALAPQQATGMDSEWIGDYRYFRGKGSGTPQAARAALVASLLPKRDSLVTLYAESRRVIDADPVINRAEAYW